MKLLREALNALDVDDFYCVDFETYYDNDYSLRKMATTEYIIDPRFEMQLAAVMHPRWSKPRVFVGAAAFAKWANGINWKRTAFLAHHCQFDGLIASHHFGVKPAAYFDTLSMGRPVMPVTVGGSLVAMCKAFGRTAKVFSQALVDVKGKRLDDFSKDELARLVKYAGGDTVDELFLFFKLLPHLPIDELRLISETIRMYAQPTIMVNEARARAVHVEQVSKKNALLSALKMTPTALRSSHRFAEALRALNVEPPTKISPKTKTETLAFAKTDLEFKALLRHPDARVRQLVEARLAVSSSLLETRSERIADRARIGAQPIYLKYWGAKTGRWSGGDKANYQNLTRGSELRKSLIAPPGHSLVIADLSQIEARLNAWHAGQQNIVDAFRRGDDVYAIAASGIYGRKIDKAKDPNERFVGKVAVLALGYGAGAARFAEMLRIGAFGPPVDITDNEAQNIVRAWRAANQYIVASWKRAENNMRNAALRNEVVEEGVLRYQGEGDRVLTILPNGTYIRYDRFGIAEDGSMSYTSDFRTGRDGFSETRSKLYGGLVIENNIQALATCAMKGVLLDILDALAHARIAMSTHDEAVLVVADRRAASAERAVNRIMSKSPPWAPDVPIAAEVHVSKIYDK